MPDHPAKAEKISRSPKAGGRWVQAVDGTVPMPFACLLVLLAAPPDWTDRVAFAAAPTVLDHAR